MKARRGGRRGTRIAPVGLLLAALACWGAWGQSGAEAAAAPPATTGDVVEGQEYGISGAIEGDVVAPTIVRPPAEAAVPNAPFEGDEEKTPFESLTLRERVAQLMIVSPQGAPAPDSADRALLLTYPPGGVVLPPLMKPQSAAEYVSALRALPIESQRGIPLLIAVDFHQLPKYGWGPRNYFPPVPSLMSVAAAADPEATARLAQLIGGQMSAIGINMYLGPSLTLAPTLDGALGDIQCLGSDPEFVGEAGETLLRTLTEQGTIVAPTGFPGGGLNRLQRGPAVLLTPLPMLAEMDLAPYIRAIGAGAPMIHVGGTLAATIDSRNLPACMSSAVMEDLLRDQLGFTGVILAGPMDGEDVSTGRDASEAARIALESGADMLLWNSAGQRVAKTVDLIVAAIMRGEMNQDVVDNALRRVLDMKDRHELLGRPAPKPREAEKIEKKRTYPREAYAVERRSVTLVQNRDETLPLTKLRSMPVGITGVRGVEELHGYLEKELKHVAQQPILTARHAGRIMDFEIDRLTRNLNGPKTAICVLTPDLAPAGQVDLIRALKAKGMRVVVVLVGYPSSLPDLVLADAILITYSDPAALDEAMRAVSDVLMGKGPVAMVRFVRDVRMQAGVPERFNALEIIRTPAGRLPVTVGEPFVAGLAVPYDPTYAVRKVEWAFGDGTKAKEFATEKAFTEPGRYPITLTITETNKDVTSTTFYATVEEATAGAATP